MKEDVSKFVNACIAKGEGENSGDTKNDRKYYQIIHAVYLKLKAEHRLDELLELLDDKNLYVKLWAAGYLLEAHPARAEKALEELAAARGNMAGFNASMTLKEWRAGRLKLQ
ncbi:MAG TPA: DUF2019 domain-containing protein [Firmicutes bacterium]|nr:DUF2019 domain-containing protein [Bacillota bacterium]